MMTNAGASAQISPSKKVVVAVVAVLLYLLLSQMSSF
jgi:hypothetical protein